MGVVSRYSEVDVAKRVVEYLQDSGWEIYQEVASQGSAADIVGVKDHQCRIVEVKTSLTTEVCAQALNWSDSRAAHYVHVAVLRPVRKKGFRPRYSRGQEMLMRFLRSEGVGVFTVQFDSFRGEEVVDILEKVPARLSRKLGDDIRKDLYEKQKTYAEAGNAEGKRWTPWRETCENWAGFVSRHPGCSLKDCVERAGHHYGTESAARSSMWGWIKVNRVPGIRYERDGKRIRLYRKAE